MELALALACVAALLAGFVDAFAGGGGLVQLPAVMLLMPGAPVPLVLGTNKGAAIWGTLVAFLRYARTVPLPWRAVGAAAAAAFMGAFAGARTSTLLSNAVLRPLVLVLLVAMAIFTAVRKDFGRAQAAPRGGLGLAVGIGAVIGFYDGFFGPGTGTFLIVLFIWSLGLDFLGASAAAKGVNVATNLAALLSFASAGQVRWAWALPMAVCNAVGGALGARVALRRGAGLVRRFFQVVTLVLLARLAWDVVHG